MQVNIREITGVQLYRDPQRYRRPGYAVDVWTGSRRLRLIYFKSTPTYGHLEPCIGEQTKRIVEAAVQECGAV